MDKKFYIQHFFCSVHESRESSGTFVQAHHHGLVTDGNTKLCCRGFILALFQSTTAIKIDSELT